MENLERGTLVEFSSWGNPYTGFIVGTCAYDNGDTDNAYVIRYVSIKHSDMPGHPYTICDMNRVELVKEFPEDFYVGGYWSASPYDRCKEWLLERRDGKLFVVPSK